MKKFILSFTALILTTFMFGQITDLQQLDEVLVSAVNYKYLSAVDNQEVPMQIKEVERQVATYDIKESEMYQDEYDQYTVAFFIPDGRIVAAYDKNGTVLRTIEKFTNYQLPDAVRSALKERFPNWEIVKDVYRVSYHHKKGEATRKYKVKLQNNDKTLRVKLDEKGNFI
ncbi:MAG: nicotinate-nucleotide adenylyltransferase [Flavobacteriaceae bacterium]|nr:nicotinate-nucleotide adenylyltransferase [Flavobacteriaceae bacterium]NNK60948.1 nicotinate-nucleotide adenylyltransferase [Flavobacteriaceae bacterium]